VQEPLRTHTQGEPPGGWRGAQPPLAGCGSLCWTVQRCEPPLLLAPGGHREVRGAV